jgi:RimJ/RimL family protein N-acetyltransferase
MFSDLLRDDIFRLETARLWLRWPRMADAQSIVRYAGEKQVAQMTATVPHPYSREEAEKFIFSCRAGNAAGRQIALTVTRKGKQGEAIGMIGIHETRPGHAFMGYWLGSPFHGQGLMSEAAEAMVALAFRASDLETLDAEALVENAGSRRVLEKCGFAYVDSGPVNLPVRGGVFQRARYALDRNAWAIRSASPAHTIVQPAITGSAA